MTINYRLDPQPANSPDLNVLDLALFWSMATEYYATPAMNINELVGKILDMFAKYPFENILYSFLTLQAVMNKIIDHDGRNNYKLPHLGKKKMKSIFHLPKALPVTPKANEYDAIFECKQINEETINR